MTPLHCAIRTGAVGACTVLLSVKEVNVNAKLARSGRCRRGMWYAEGIFWKEENYRLFLLQEHDTPLHMAFRICEGEDIRKIVIDLCNLSYFNGAALNASGETAFELAESRLGMCAPVPSIFSSRRKLPKLLHKNQYTDSRNLADALAFLSCHPSTSAYMTFVNYKKKISDDSVNAFLVTATLLAGITFAAYLQPPFGTAFGDYRSRAVKLFWTFNSLSFYFSVYTILRCLLTIMRSDQIVLVDREEYFQLLRMEHAVPLILSVVLGIGAFVAAGYGNLPPESKGLMVACTVSGLLLVLFQAFRNVYVCIRLCLNPPVDENTGFVESIFPLVVIFSGPVTIPVLVVCRYLIWKMRCVEDHDYCNFLLRSALVGIHFIVSVVVTLYALIKPNKI
ncbi:hypothetical protein Mapa_017420 [Marchantia paleacea]|nr:hypothetical protein Mapa_017420 [Marchantia paleacea]